MHKTTDTSARTSRKNWPCVRRVRQYRNPRIHGKILGLDSTPRGTCLSPNYTSRSLCETYYNQPLNCWLARCYLSNFSLDRIIKCPSKFTDTQNFVNSRVHTYYGETARVSRGSLASQFVDCDGDKYIQCRNVVVRTDTISLSVYTSSRLISQGRLPRRFIEWIIYSAGV